MERVEMLEKRIWAVCPVLRKRFLSFKMQIGGPITELPIFKENKIGPQRTPERDNCAEARKDAVPALAPLISTHGGSLHKSLPGCRPRQF
jgi:hypothetical protein